MLTLAESAALLHKTHRDYINALILVQIICYVYVQHSGESSDLDVNEEFILCVLEIYCFCLFKVTCIERTWKTV